MRMLLTENEPGSIQVRAVSAGERSPEVARADLRVHLACKGANLSVRISSSTGHRVNDRRRQHNDIDGLAGQRFVRDNYEISRVIAQYILLLLRIEMTGPMQ
jgi:hypothetical protein